MFLKRHTGKTGLQTFKQDSGSQTLRQNPGLRTLRQEHGHHAIKQDPEHRNPDPRIGLFLRNFTKRTPWTKFTPCSLDIYGDI